MAETGISWGAVNGHLRLGINVRWDDIGAGTAAITIYIDYYVQPQAWGYNDDQTLTKGGSIGGAVGYHLNSATGASPVVLVNTHTITGQGTSYGGGPTYTFSGSISGAYDGSAPSHSVNWTMPARPPSPPDAPGTNYDGLGATGVHIFLSAPANNGGAAIDAYETYLLTNNAWPGSGGNVKASAASFSLYATGLTHTTTYYYTGRARNAAGLWSGFAAMKAVTTLSTTPTAPGQPSTSDLTATTGTLSWAAPADNGGAAITGYRLQISALSTFATLTHDSTANTLSRAVTGLTPNQPYYARVQAVNANGGGAWSTVRQFNTTATVPVAMLAPTLAEDPWPTSALLGFLEPNNGGSAITSYDLQVGVNNAFADGTYNLYHPGTSGGSPFAATGLTPGALQYARIRAVNSYGPGDWSPLFTFITPSVAWAKVASSWRTGRLWVKVVNTWKLARIWKRISDTWYS